MSLFWLPLGADGNPVVRWSGHIYEALVARRDHRERRDLFHTALRVQVDGAIFVVEMAPAWGAPALDRGVVKEGAVGLAWLGRFRFFCYEIRRWRDGVIPDADQAVDSPVDLGAAAYQARALLALVPECPTPVWGRDDLGTVDMWNSNSVVAWLLTRAGLHGGELAPPAPRSSPGWGAGVGVAQRRLERSASTPRAPRDVTAGPGPRVQRCAPSMKKTRVTFATSRTRSVVRSSRGIAWSDRLERRSGTGRAAGWATPSMGSTCLSDTSAHTERSGGGSASSRSRVAFEIDQYDERTHAGWSVLVRGIATAAELDQYPPRRQPLPGGRRQAGLPHPDHG